MSSAEIGRKLTAILAADVVGYCRLAGADEEQILARLRALRSDLIDPTIALHHGRIVKRSGDGMIVEFRSVVDAVRCAIEIQSAMVDRNAGLAPDQRIVFRVGVHLGDVVEEADGDLMGDGVNVAARLEGTCEPGGLCLSSAAYEQVRDRLKERFVNLGEKPLKNIARPVRAYGLPASAIVVSKGDSGRTTSSLKASGLWSRWPTTAAAFVIAVVATGGYAWHAGFAPRLLGASFAEDKLATAPRLSIVVLPFENFSGDPEQAYFADGLTDDLTTDLSHVEGSFVIARDTAFTYKGKAVDVKQIGRVLGVRYVLEGSVRRVGETITVNAQLISTETGAHVWADRFDGERSKLGELQVDFVSRLANSLGGELVKAEALRGMRERPDNPDAVDLAMQGWAAYDKGFTAANWSEALGYFERALQLDPELTRAKLGLALGLIDRVASFGSGNEPVDLPRAEALITSTLSAEPNNAWAHFVKADLAFARKQYNDTLSELDVAIEIDRNFAHAYGFRGVTQIFVGRAKDSFSGLEAALRLSAQDPIRHLWESEICYGYAHMAEWEKAAEWCQKSIATNPGNLEPYVSLAAADGWLGREAEAKAAIVELQNVKPGLSVQAWLGMCGQTSDNPTFLRESQRIVEGLRKAGLPEGDAKSN